MEWLPTHPMSAARAERYTVLFNPDSASTGWFHLEFDISGSPLTLALPPCNPFR